MKRINPATGVPFKKGDIRENGDVFYQYRKIIEPWNSPYFVEYWLKPELFKKHNFTDRSGENRTINRLATTLLGQAKSRCLGTPSRVASGRMPTNGEVTITLEWIVERLEKGVCEATGDLLTTKTRQPNTASLDRIDPKNPNYTPENSRIVAWQFNNMKGAYTDEEFIRVAEALKNVKQKQFITAPNDGVGKSKNNTQLGIVHGVRPRKNSDGAHHHRGEPEGQDLSDSTEAGCRICMGTGVQKMATLATFYGNEGDGDTLCSAEEFAKRIRCLCYQPRERSVAC